MMVDIGQVEAIFRYPVKSMAGERLEAAELGWHGLEGDRRLALRRLEDRGGFPWLSAGKLPELGLFAPRPAGRRGPGRAPHPRSHAGGRRAAGLRRGAGGGGRAPARLTRADDALAAGDSPLRRAPR